MSVQIQYYRFNAQTMNNGKGKEYETEIAPPSFCEDTLEDTRLIANNSRNATLPFVVSLLSWCMDSLFKHKQNNGHQRNHNCRKG